MDQQSPVSTRGRRLSRRNRWVAATAALATVAMIGLQPATSFGQNVGGGGTAKPPAPKTTPPQFRVFPALAGMTPSGALENLHQFDMTGFIQNATVDGSICPTVTNPASFGGSVKVNGITVVVPCNTVIQMPANTLTWSSFVNAPDNAIKLTSLEVHVIGNTVGMTGATSKYVAGLVYLSEQALNQGQGFITSIDYSTGNIHVGANAGAPDQAVLQLNDPTGEFGLKQSRDARFSVDAANPTVHAITGYPMCVPRTDPATADDPLCPQVNRPKLGAFTAAGPACRDWVTAVAGLNPALPMPKGLNLNQLPVTGQVYCGSFVMAATPLAAYPMDSTQQAPFEVGDYITYAGTRLAGSNGADGVLSAHTIEAQTAIYTQPGSKPSYMAIGQFGVGTADPNILTAITGVAQETQNRIFLEAVTTDPYSLVDIYMTDAQLQPLNANGTPNLLAGGAPMSPVAGSVHNRWITPYEMTGEQGVGIPAATATTPAGTGINANVFGGANTFGGGIDTMMTGVQTPRARLRATKAPVGLLDSPTRNIRVVSRSLCTPAAQGVAGGIDTPVLPTVNGVTGTTLGACTDSVVAANGLSTGQYVAPNFGFIFPENAQKGQPVVPNDLWHLGFLSNGEGGTGPLNPGALIPTPW